MSSWPCLRGRARHNKFRYPLQSQRTKTVVGNILKTIFGTKNARTLKGMRPLVARIGELEPTMQKKSDAELRDMTPEFRRRLDRGATLDELLPEAFATVREAGRRVLSMR